MERKQRRRPSNVHPSLSNRNKANEEKKKRWTKISGVLSIFASPRDMLPVTMPFTCSSLISSGAWRCHCILSFFSRMLQRQCKSRKLIVALCLREKFIFYYSIFLGVFSLNMATSPVLQSCKTVIRLSQFLFCSCPSFACRSCAIIIHALVNSMQLVTRATEHWRWIM